MNSNNIVEIRDPDLESEAASLYNPKLAYHNFEHVIDTIKAAEHIISRCTEEGIRVDHRVVYYALLFHDAGYAEDHEVLGFESKEAYSADLAAKKLHEREVSQRTIDKVVAAILATHKDANFITVEQKAVRAADLSGLAADYEVFLDNSKKLQAEHEFLYGETFEWAQWVEHICIGIEFYLAQEIRLTSYFANERGESAFHQAVRENLERLIAEAR